jgi:hypothetical protein
VKHGVKGIGAANFYVGADYGAFAMQSLNRVSAKRYEELKFVDVRIVAPEEVDRHAVRMLPGGLANREDERHV